jgi:hypothetical protein
MRKSLRTVILAAIKSGYCLLGNLSDDLLGGLGRLLELHSGKSAKNDRPGSTLPTASKEAAILS